MLINLEHKGYQQRLLQKSLGQSAGNFLNRLIFWTENKNGYGIEKYGKTWIYNTLSDWANQLKCSSKTIQRCVQRLKELNLIDSKHLAGNKRDRTCFYCVNYSELISFFEKKSVHMGVQMYIRNRKHKINKSDKPKTTTVQDMIKIWKKYYPDNVMKLTKSLARNLVAAFKLKFHRSMQEWEKYLQCIYKNKNGSINSIIQFEVIDDHIEICDFDKKIEIHEKNMKAALDHISSLQESETCKNMRKEVVRKYSAEKYIAWFTKVDLFEQNGSIIARLKKVSNFVRDYMNTNFIGLKIV